MPDISDTCSCDFTTPEGCPGGSGTDGDFDCVVLFDVIFLVCACESTTQTFALISWASVLSSASGGSSRYFCQTALFCSSSSFMARLHLAPAYLARACSTFRL